MIEKIKEFINGPVGQRVLFFDELLTPSLIRLAYWLCLLSVLWTGLGKMFSGGLSGFLEGIVFTIVGSLLARVGAEVIILLFKVNENIEIVANNSKPATVKRKAAKKVTKKTTAN